MQARARVLQVDGGEAVVELTRQTGGCGRCHEPGGCGGGLAGLVGGGQRKLRLPNDAGAAPGDTVCLVVDDRVGLRTALVVYVLPVVFIVVCAALAKLIGGGGDQWSLAGAALGAAAAVAMIRVYQRRQVRGQGVLMLLDEPLAADTVCTLDEGGARKRTS